MCIPQLLYNILFYWFKIIIYYVCDKRLLWYIYCLYCYYIVLMLSKVGDNYKWLTTFIIIAKLFSTNIVCATHRHEFSVLKINIFYYIVCMHYVHKVVDIKVIWKKCAFKSFLKRCLVCKEKTKQLSVTIFLKIFIFYIDI